MKLSQLSSGLCLILFSSRHQALKVKTIHSIKRFNHVSIKNFLRRLTFFVFSVLAIVVHWETFGSVTHPLLTTAVESILIEILKLKIFVAFVERNQKQFLALSTPFD